MLKRPLTALVATVQDGRFLKFVFLAMLGLSVGTVAQDYRQMLALSPEGAPGSQRIEPAPMELPIPGDQTRTYLPKTMPLGPGREAPRLPGLDGPPVAADMSAPMKFSLGVGGRVSALGTIDQGTAERLEKFLASHDREAVSELVLHSPGGSVSDALKMARMIRTAGISTSVPENGYCASSCPLLLAGGLHRRASERSFIGVHQVYALPNAVGTLQRGMADAQTVSALCQQLLVDMGIDLKVWVKAMQTPPAQLYVFTPGELSRFRLANGTNRIAAPLARPAKGESGSP